MNAESFTKYLLNQSHLYQITYQELKSLVLQYPYCQNLRYLLARKSQLDNNQELDANTKYAASYSVDRQLFFRQFQEKIEKIPVSEDNFFLEKEYMELKELNKLEKKIDEGTLIPPIESVEQEVIPVPEDQLSIPIVIEETMITPLPKQEKIIDEPIAEFLDPDNFKEEIDPPVVSKDENLEQILNAHEAPVLQQEIKPSGTPDLIEAVIKKEELTEEVVEVEVKSSVEDQSAPIKPDENETLPDDQEIIPTDSETPVLSFIDQLRLKNNKLDQSEENEVTDPLPNIEDKKDSSFEKLIAEKAIEIGIHSSENIETKTNKIDELEDLLKEDAIDGNMDEESLIPFEITNHDSDLEDLFKEEGHVAAPAPKTSFGSWIKQFQQDPKSEDNIDGIHPDLKKKKKDKKKKKKKKGEKANNKLGKIIENDNSTSLEKLEAFSTPEITDLEEVMPELKKEKSKKKSKDKTKDKELLKAKEKTKKKKDKKKKKKKKVKAKAKLSVKENKQIASETLAQLLVKQGSLNKAIRMYERLCLIFPDRKAFFEEQINSLKK